MNEETRRLADKAEQFLLLIERIETDDPPESGEYDELKGELIDAIEAVRGEEVL